MRIERSCLGGMIRMVLAMMALLLVAGGGAARGDESGTRPSTRPTKGTLRFGLPPWQKGLSVDEVRDQYKPMLDWLAEKTGYQFVIVGGESYEAMVEMVARGQVQLASLSPVPYVEAKKKNPEIQLLVTEVKWNEDRTKLVDAYTGYIVTLKSRTDLNSLADLKGKRFGFVNHESSSGYRYPTAILKEKGITPATYFAKCFFLGSHPRVTDALVDGSIDAGATWDFNLEQAVRKHGDVFKVILSTPPIPNLCVVAHPALPPEVQAQIREALLHIDPKRLKGTPAVGYRDRPDSFYDVVRTLVASEDKAAQN